MKEAKRKWPLSIPDTILFFSGLGLTVYTTIGTRTERPSLTALFATMMGLAWARSSDKRKKDGQ